MTFELDSIFAHEARPAVNFDERRAGLDILLLHYTGMETAEAACERLCAAPGGVSCHYFVFEDGRVLQLVPERARAWHAGVSSWEDETDVNSRSVGVEIVNPGHEFGYRDFPDAQIRSVIDLSRDICARNAILPERVLAHSDVAPRRKQDPGERFPWGLLAAEGVGHWVPPTAVEDAAPKLGEGDVGEPVEELQALLSIYGYRIEIDGTFGPTTAAVVRAFQRHFRPVRVDGVADFSTAGTLRKLLKALPAR